MALKVVTIENSQNDEVLKTPAQDIQFPLSKDVKNLIKEMKEKIHELKGSGLAAPQVGHGLRLIIFEVSPYATIFRADAYEEVPLTTLINPSYEPIESEGTTEDWEGCFSLTEVMGKVPRYNVITYTGFDERGRPVEGEARGFLARVLQHEIDHTRGILIADILTSKHLQGHPNDMIALRQKDMDAQHAKHGKKSEKSHDNDPIDDLSED